MGLAYTLAPAGRGWHGPFGKLRTPGEGVAGEIAFRYPLKAFVASLLGTLIRPLGFLPEGRRGIISQTIQLALHGAELLLQLVDVLCFRLAAFLCRRLHEG